MIREDPFFSNTHRTCTETDWESRHTASLSKFTIGKNGSCLIVGSWVPYHNILISAYFGKKIQQYFKILG